MATTKSCPNYIHLLVTILCTISSCLSLFGTLDCEFIKVDIGFYPANTYLKKTTTVIIGIFSLCSTKDDMHKNGVDNVQFNGNDKSLPISYFSVDPYHSLGFSYNNFGRYSNIFDTIDVGGDGSSKILIPGDYWWDCSRLAAIFCTASSITAMVSLFIESLLFWILIDITKRYYYRGGGEDLLLDRGFTTKSEDIRRGCRDTYMAWLRMLGLRIIQSRLRALVSIAASLEIFKIGFMFATKICTSNVWLNNSLLRDEGTFQLRRAESCSIQRACISSICAGIVQVLVTYILADNFQNAYGVADDASGVVGRDGLKSETEPINADYPEDADDSRSSDSSDYDDEEHGSENKDIL